MNDACKRFDEVILELVYDELSPEHAQELRSHAVKCPRCSDALKEIEKTRVLVAGLPLLEPDSRTDNAVLAAAHRAVEDWKRDDSRVVEPALFRQGRPVVSEKRPDLMQLLRSWLLTPAFATVVVAALVFVVSFFLVEHAKPPTDLSAMQHRAPFYGPAVPFEERQDKEPQQNQTTNAMSPKASQPIRMEIDPAPSIARVEQESSQREALRSRIAPSRGSDTGVSEGPTGSGDKPELKPEGLTASMKQKATSFERRDALPDAKKARVIIGSDDGASPSLPSEDRAPKRSAIEDTNRPGAADMAAGANLADDIAVDLDTLNPSACSGAAAELRKTESNSADASTRSVALHKLAQCERNRGRCAEALLWYDVLLAGYISYAGRAQALWEAAACHQRLGQVEQAGVLLKKLARFPKWTDRANQELRRLDLEQD